MLYLNAYVLISKAVLDKFVFCFYYKVYSNVLYFSVYKSGPTHLVINVEPF
ncbi:hypothetical protein CSC26_0685 [Pseudomonas aeruginosa]|nr:hypothetical protein CSC26_0685 [Pseudomonas aeruginosa]